ncbi:efflux RND transporter periplasmic adaptor subunit [Methylobacterium gnaphalii]|uniref:Hemolysin secretion protein D n=1 Tax=Methylobacterium gnaphalii TaxID=1010610 RepID=A0A512JIX8_9HYPH|nr:efflux RND transporter periplasmic adaptor subunit [Methylobacterium gnaphalii]GEP09915.1 hemolysin secretion protein D [Methylobacterium gnaphalii]GJD68310.1 Solvent efflux pump periplasmic linker SrpA [Methylobacterium gnaphalii]GLS49944.1 hemolysin secretion protein D [Methylobacterium gnaphalii]
MVRFPRLARLAPVSALAALTLASCGPDSSGPPPPLVRSFVVATAGTGAQRFTGVVHARIETALGFRVAGKISERLVDPGERVRRGQPLMRLDHADFTLALQSAKATVDAARAQMVKTAADEKRSRKLATEGWVSIQAYDQIKASADAAAAQFSAAEAQASQIGNQAAYAELQADADGVVMEVPAEPGQVVGAGQIVVRLARDGAREAEVFLPEGAERMAQAEATATLYAGRDAAFPAHLRELSAVADPVTRTYRARYVLEGAGESAPLGATVTIALKPSLRGNDASFAVPLAAIFDSGGGPSVWKIDPDRHTVSAQPVLVTRMREESADIAFGLSEGDRIVALGAHLLKGGQLVRVAADRVAEMAE